MRSFFILLSCLRLLSSVELYSFHYLIPFLAGISINLLSFGILWIYFLRIFLFIKQILLKSLNYLCYSFHTVGFLSLCLKNEDALTVIHNFRCACVAQGNYYTLFGARFIHIWTSFRVLHWLSRKRR